MVFEMSDSINTFISSDDLMSFAGGCPAASYFLLLRQKESNQRKGDPMSRRAKAARFPLFLKIIGGCATRGEKCLVMGAKDCARHSDSARLNPPTIFRKSSDSTREAGTWFALGNALFAYGSWLVFGLPEETNITTVIPAQAGI
jgi:hypothetical protein